MGSAGPVSQQALTIREAIRQLRNRTYLLPVVRGGEPLWSPEQILRFYDNIVQEGSTGRLLLWRPGKDRMHDCHFLDFSGDRTDSVNQPEQKSCIAGRENVLAVIDGKRLLASLYIGLVGLDHGVVPGGNQDKNEYLRDRKLYLNLLSQSTQSGKSCEFRFLTKRESLTRDNETFWFEVGKVLDFTGTQDVIKYLAENDLKNTESAKDRLLKFYSIINERRTISYFLETSEELGKVLMMFL
jgi:hypothetical protein